MTIDIRKTVLENFKNSSHEEIVSSINEAINSKEEKALPGLGVFFEVLWNNSDPIHKTTIIDTLLKQL